MKISDSSGASLPVNLRVEIEGAREENSLYDISLEICNGKVSPDIINFLSRNRCQTLTSTNECNNICNTVRGCGGNG